MERKILTAEASHYVPLRFLSQWILNAISKKTFEKNQSIIFYSRCSCRADRKLLF